MHNLSHRNQEGGNETNNPSLSRMFDLMEQQAYLASKEKGAAKPTPPEFSVSLDALLLECSDLPIAGLSAEESLDASVMANFKTLWFDGNRFLLAPLPFVEGGYGKGSLPPEEWRRFIESKNFLRPLCVYSDHMTSNYGRAPNYYADLFPEEIRRDISEGGCSFEIKYSKPRDYSDPHDAKIFRDNYQQAVANLIKIFRGSGPSHGSDSVH
ncbi:hypothetical protein ACFL2V_04390 [Pseudomonadota bacterium]